MKKLTKLSAVLAIAIIALAIPAWAQTPTEPQSSGGGSGGGSVSVPASILPIEDQATARQYMLGNPVRGSRSVYSDSIDWDFEGTITSVSATGTGAEEILDKLFSAELRYFLTNPNDKVRGWVYLYDAKNNLLFHGTAEYLASIIGKEKPMYDIWMQEIPLLSDVKFAEVLALGEDGTTARRYRLEVNQYGQVKFPPWYSGAPNGLLAVKFNNGTVATYKLAKPVGSSPSSTTETVASWKIEGHYVCAGNVNIIETWNRPTALVDLTHNDIDINLDIDVMGLVQKNGKTYFERPSAMIVTIQREDGSWTPEEPVELDPNGPTTFKGVDPIKFRARFVWREFGLPNLLYTGPEYDGGKG